MRRNGILLALICLLWSCAMLVGMPARTDEATVTVERGVGLLTNGDIDAARQVLAPVAGETPDALMLSARGTLELLADNPAAADANFRQALEDDPAQLSALWGLSLSLLQRHRAFEATALLDRAALAAPTDTRVKTLQAYACLLLGRYADATVAGKAALEAGDTSPFLLATLAQVHYQLGYTAKALEFGLRAARVYDGMNFLDHGQQITLPLTMIITDTPQVLAPSEPEAIHPPAQRTDLELALPAPSPVAVEQKPFQIVAPDSGSAVRGVQRVRVAYRGTREIKFLVFLADHVLRGMITTLPYHFAWDADAVPPGEHTLTVRAYDYRGVAVEEDSVTVMTRVGDSHSAPETSERVVELEKRLLALTFPLPEPRSLFTRLGTWHKELGESARAMAAFEKAAALDPEAEGLLTTLAGCYQANGLHLLTPSGEVSRAETGGLKRVALTFDDGPNPLYTPDILTELKRYHAKGTFFLVGKMVQQYPELPLQILADGHELANHSYTHPNLTKIKQTDLIAEVLRTRTVIKEVTGQQTYLFRPPGGNIDPFVVRQLRALDYNIIYWDINAGEYRKAATPADQSAQIMAKIRPGSIVLLHNGLVDGTLNFLGILLNDLNQHGYACITVSEILSTRPEATKLTPVAKPYEEP